ncbi:hypothetical protein MJO28_009566 [Puccinia striiformis f. sp. tritici]|uniref:Uncharacterized protein n=1 Tax=Puccinia striiformis f. sp. tritici TaxID=168172 RepID=A0ACC0E853_9BASI|nr:hypothetical protein Pst134EB_018472 [Puccinia striiformis f. sp. tritici]KAI7947658.1 hypothetical protein MJO28_009566 [Puccinia striiformis f. sp. tritici]
MPFPVFSNPFSSSTTTRKRTQSLATNKLIKTEPTQLIKKLKSYSKPHHIRTHHASSSLPSPGRSRSASAAATVFEIVRPSRTRNREGSSPITPLIPPLPTPPSSTTITRCSEPSKNSRFLRYKPPRRASSLDSTTSTPPEYLISSSRKFPARGGTTWSYRPSPTPPLSLTSPQTKQSPTPKPGSFTPPSPDISLSPRSSNPPTNWTLNISSLNSTYYSVPDRPGTILKLRKSSSTSQLEPYLHKRIRIGEDGIQVVEWEIRLGLPNNQSMPSSSSSLSFKKQDSIPESPQNHHRFMPHYNHIESLQSPPNLNPSSSIITLNMDRLKSSSIETHEDHHHPTLRSLYKSTINNSEPRSPSSSSSSSISGPTEEDLEVHKSLPINEHDLKGVKPLQYRRKRFDTFVPSASSHKPGPINSLYPQTWSASLQNHKNDQAGIETSYWSETDTTSNKSSINF